jgi:hypothetical protein
MSSKNVRRIDSVFRTRLYLYAGAKFKHNYTEIYFRKFAYTRYDVAGFVVWIDFTKEQLYFLLCSIILCPFSLLFSLFYSIPLLNWAPDHEDLRESGGITPGIHNLDTGWRWMVSFTSRRLYPRCSLDGPQSLSGRCVEKRVFRPCRESNLLFLGSPVHCLSSDSTLKMEAICSSETSVYFQRTTRRYIREDSTNQPTSVCLTESWRRMA